MKRIVSFLLMLSVLNFISINIYAIDSYNEDIYVDTISTTMERDFSLMTVDELNAYIDNIVASYNVNETVGVQSTTANIGPVESAWLAAAEIARQNGYPFAAKIVENSVYNINYSETTDPFGLNGGLPFINKIKETQPFIEMSKKVLKNGVDVEITDPDACKIIEKKDDADLFYALHKIGYSAKFQPSLVGMKRTCLITMEDTFDFELENNYDDLFTTLVNNWGWLCENAGVLHPIKITLKTAIFDN